MIKIWKMAGIKAERRVSKDDARKAKGDKARIARAIRLLRRGAISRAGQALETKGLGNLDNPEIWEQMQSKHPRRKEHIDEEMFQFKPEEEVELSVAKILPKLDMNAAPGPAGLRNAHIRMWTGVFAPASADEAIHHLEEMLTDMANDKLPAWFM